MGFILRTPAGTYRANWRDPTGRQKSKTFRTKKDASAFLAEVETAVNRGAYVDPHAGRMRFGDFAARWLSGRRVEARTAERTRSLMRTHVLPRWADWPLSAIDHMTIQEWIATLGQQLAPATVRKCHSLLHTILKTAVRARLLTHNPAEGIQLPAIRSEQTAAEVISQADFFGRLLPAIPTQHRAIVSVAAGAGLRWGECAGLVWANIAWDGWDDPCKPHRARWCPRCLPGHRPSLRVAQVAVETPEAIALRPYPKTRAGARTVPLPAFLAVMLARHQDRLERNPDPRELVFASVLGGPLRRSNFRRRVWRPSLVRAGLLGRVEQLGEHKYRAVWPDATGVEWSAEFTTAREAVAQVARKAAGGLRFHDLRHSYATWLVSRGVPVNDVQDAMGHERASTTLDLYTHRSEGRDQRIREAFADDPLTLPGETDSDHDTPDGYDDL